MARAESVPNLTRKYATWIQGDADVREQLSRMEQALGIPATIRPEKT
jgi:hypothetical protein